MLEKDLTEAQGLIASLRSARRIQEESLRETRAEGARMLKWYTKAGDARQLAGVKHEEAMKEIARVREVLLGWNVNGGNVPGNGEGDKTHADLQTDLLLAQIKARDSEAEIKKLDAQINWMRESGVYVHYVEYAEHMCAISVNDATLRAMGKRYEKQVKDLGDQLETQTTMVVSLEKVLSGRGKDTGEYGALVILLPIQLIRVVL